MDGNTFKRSAEGFLGSDFRGDIYHSGDHTRTYYLAARHWPKRGPGWIRFVIASANPRSSGPVTAGDVHFDGNAQIAQAFRLDTYDVIAQETPKTFIVNGAELTPVFYPWRSLH